MFKPGRVLGLFAFTLGVTMASGVCFGSDFGMQELITLAGTPEVHRIADLISKLPEDLRSHFILVQDSRSMQHASPDFPRVILYQEEGSPKQMLVAFNGDPAASGYGFVEAIQFDAMAGTYEFRRFDFPQDQGGSGPAQVSAANPPVCVSCHTAGFRPNWSAYSNWSGAIPSSSGFDGFQANEEQVASNFLAAAQKNARYSGLILPKSKDDFLFRPEALENNFVWESANYISSWLVQSPRYETYRYALAAALSDCDDLASFVPATQGGNSANLASLLTDTLAESTSFDELGMEEDHEHYTQSVTAGLRFLVESRQISIRHLSYSFDMPYITQVKGAQIYTGVLGALASRDAELPGDTAAISEKVLNCHVNYDPPQCMAGDPATIAAYCSRLKDASLAAFAREPSWLAQRSFVAKAPGLDFGQKPVPR